MNIEVLWSRKYERKYLHQVNVIYVFEFDLLVFLISDATYNKGAGCVGVCLLVNDDSSRSVLVDLAGMGLLFF
ncbi:2-hydroxyacid dehydrogenase, partial [Erwinia amylovora]|nr:2-hydroxyacid dehydrogenase [Erwinia amylovora]